MKFRPLLLVVALIHRQGQAVLAHGAGENFQEVYLHCSPQGVMAQKTYWAQTIRLSIPARVLPDGP